jgi:hypothetical protein
MNDLLKKTANAGKTGTDFYRRSFGIFLFERCCWLLKNLYFLL